MHPSVYRNVIRAQVAEAAKAPNEQIPQMPFNEGLMIVSETKDSEQKPQQFILNE